MKIRAKGKEIFWIGLSLLFWTLTLSPPAACAEIPARINYQGYLTEPDGTPVNASVPMTFSIYSAETGGTALWSETRSVAVVAGIYSINIGEGTPLTLPFDALYFLGIAVGSDPEMTPRKPLTSVPYAFRAKSVETDQDTLGRLSCGSGQVPEWDGAAWVCGGAGAAYTAGTGLSQAGTVFSADTAYLQRRISDTCPGGNAIRVVNADGTVTCETITGGGSPSSSVSALDGSSAPGSSPEFSRGDHKHGIGSGSITSAHILDGTILFADIGSNGCASGQVIKWNGTAWTCATANEGTSSATVSTLTGTGAAGTAVEYSRGDHAHAIGTGAITSAHILNGTLVNEDISSVAAIDFSKLSGVAPSVHNHDSTYLKLNQADSITSAMIVDGAVGPSDVGFNYAGSSSKGGAASGLDCVGCVTGGHLADDSVGAGKIDKGPAVAGEALIYDGTNVVWGNPASAPVSLPYSGSASSAFPVFSITNTGSGRAAYFDITEASSAADTLVAVTSGTGSAGSFAVQNETNSNVALLASTAGTGYAGFFAIFNDASVSPALYATTSGTGHAGYFEGTVNVTKGLSASSFHGDGTGLTNVDADRLDGQHAAAFASSTHQHTGNDITSGTVADGRLSGNVVLLDNAQTLTGVKTFNPSSGNAPFAVGASKTDMVTNLNADRLDGKHATDFVASGQAASVTSAMIGNGTILFANIAQNGCTPGQVMKWNGTAWACAPDNDSTGFWGLAGNSGTNPSTQFIGTTDSQPLEIRVNNVRALRIEPQALSPNMIGGHATNTVTPGVVGAVIGGGGRGVSSGNNRVTDSYGTVAGGTYNQAGDNAGTTDDRGHATVGGGSGNIASGELTTIAGGSDNDASGFGAAVGGGITNSATGDNSAVGGGTGNTASGYRATVAGGYQNVASGWGSVVPGGQLNEATGIASFAAGYKAKANHQGAFVWADSTNADFVSTIQDEFRVRASGGVEYVAGSGRWRFEPNTTSPNIVGGYSSNSLASGVTGATIGGGGESGNVNRVYDNFGTVGGGAKNQAGSNDGNTALSEYATVGGGNGNTASGGNSAIGGGFSNTASAAAATIGGGGSNTVSGSSYSTIGGGFQNDTTSAYGAIGGGYSNLVSGDFGTVPGGRENTAAGDYSLAAGRRAKANHTGTFVFADSNDFDFASLAANSFKVRATGGVRFVLGINASGGITWSCLVGDGESWSCSSDRNLKENMVEVDGREILHRVSGIPIYRWNGKGQDPSNNRHMGPMAQDFYAAFGLGTDDKHISTIDLDGVALSAIQGLYQVVQEKEARINQMEKQNVAQQQAISDLQKRLAAIELRLGLASTK